MKSAGSGAIPRSESPAGSFPLSRLNGLVGNLGVDTNEFVGFDIYACDLVGYAALTTPGDTASKFYRINLATGAATLIGQIGGGELIIGIAIR